MMASRFLSNILLFTLNSICVIECDTSYSQFCCRHIVWVSLCLFRSRKLFPMQIDGEPWMQPPAEVRQEHFTPLLTPLFWTSMIKTLFFPSSQNITSQTTQPHVNHHYRSITRPAKATDVRIKRRIFMIVPVMAIWNLVLTRQIYSEETNGAHAHYREPVPLKAFSTGHISTLFPWSAIETLKRRLVLFSDAIGQF